MPAPSCWAHGERAGLTSGGAMTRNLLHLLFSSIIIGSVTSAHAAPPTSKELPPAVAEPLERADRARDDRRCGEAAAAYKEALSAAEQASLPGEDIERILGELGLCELRMKKCAEAGAHLEMAISVGTGDRTKLTEQRKRYLDGYDRAMEACGHVQILITPEDAAIKVDGQPFAWSRYSRLRTIWLEPGEHTIRASHDGYVDFFQEIEINMGSSMMIKQELIRRPPSPAAEVRAAKPRRQSVTTPAAAGDRATSIRPVAFITAGVGLAVGTGLLLIATFPLDNAIEERMETFGQRYGYSACRRPAHAPECEAQFATVRARDTLTGLGWATVGVSGAIGVMAAASYLWNGSEERAPVRVAPVVTGSLAGAAVLGTW